MKKQVYKLGLVAFLGMSAMVFAQVQDGVVGINTESPSATLDVVTKAGSDKSLRVVNTSAVETVTVLDNGKIGINEVAPSERLEVGGSVKAKEGTLMSSISTNAGGNVLLENPLKSGADLARRWRIWNMTGGYTNSLQFWSYDENLVGTSRMMLTDNGNVAIGVDSNYVPTEKLEVAGSIKSTALAGAGTRNVVVDEHGKLTVGEAVGNGTSSDENLVIKKTVKVVPNTTSDGNGLTNVAEAGKNLRNYDGTGVPDYQDSDYMIVLTNDGINGKLQLPSAAANPGRIIYLINGTLTGLGFAAGNYDGTSDIYPFNFGTLATRSGVAFVSTGKTWYPIGR